jgi:hypothetical protein
MTEIFSAFTQYLQAKARIILSIKP